MTSATPRGGARFCAQFPETPTDLPQPASYAARIDDDREAYEFAKALLLARQVDREAAQMIVQAAEAGLLPIIKATSLLMRLSRHIDARHASG